MTPGTPGPTILDPAGQRCYPPATSEPGECWPRVPTDSARTLRASIPKRKEASMIRIDVLNFLIVWSFIIIGRFAANILAALTHDSPVGQALSLIAA